MSLSDHILLVTVLQGNDGIENGNGDGDGDGGGAIWIGLVPR